MSIASSIELRASKSAPRRLIMSNLPYTVLVAAGFLAIGVAGGGAALAQAPSARAPTAPGVTRAVEHPSNTPETATDPTPTGPETAKDDQKTAPETATDAPRGPIDKDKKVADGVKGVRSNTPPQ
jgi:hypothetical protein